MAMDFIGLSVGMGYTDETVIGGGAIKGKNCVISNIEEVADGVNVTFQSILDDGTVKTDTVFIPKGTQGEAGVAGKSAYEIWLEAGNTGTEEDFLISLVGEKGDDGKSAYQYAQDDGYIGTETEFTTNIARSGVISKELEIERARIDNLTTLQDGSTTGDAELIDARVDYIGRTHENVGTHIRYISNQLSNKLVAPHNTYFFTTSKNLFNKNDKDVVIGKYINASGEWEVNPSYGTTGFIPVHANYNYSASDKRFIVAFYDINKNWHSYLPSKLHTEYVTIPEGVYYARFLFYVYNVNTFQVEEGEECTEYEAYSSYIPSEYLEKEKIKNLNLNFTSYGDSITARNGWQNHLVERYTLNHTNLGIGSTTMAYVESVEESYPSMVNANRIQAIKDSNPDILTILGGTNDVVRNVSVGTSAELSKSLEEKDKTTFIGALSFLIETMLNWKPTLNIILLTTTYSNVASHNTIYTQYANAVREVGYYYGLKIADTNRESGISLFNTSTYTTDGIHPNELGNLKIANIVASQIEDLYRIK